VVRGVENFGALLNAILIIRQPSDLPRIRLGVGDIAVVAVPQVL